MLSISNNIALTILLFGIALSISAADITWTNGNGTNIWNDASNWSSGIPGNGDVAIFNSTSTANCTIDVDIDVDGFEIESTYSGTVVQSTGIRMLIGSDDFTQSGGTFVGGNTAILIDGEFILSGGTFTSSSDSLDIGTYYGSSSNITIFNHSGGTFNHNNGTVIFSPSSSYGDRSFRAYLSSTIMFDALVDVTNTSSGNSELQVMNSDTLFCENDLTHNDGQMDGYWALEGDLSIDSEAADGNGIVVFNGTGAQSYGYSSTVSRTCGIAVDKTSGAVSQAGGTTDLYCSSFYLIAGTFNAPTNEMRIGDYWGSSSNITIFNHSGGTFNHNNGLVEFDPSSSYGTRSFRAYVNSSTLLYDALVDVTNTSSGNSELQVMNSDTLFCENDLTHNDGQMDGYWALEGDLTIDSEAADGNGIVVFNGTGAQSYGYSSTVSRTCGIAVDKTSGQFRKRVALQTCIAHLFTSLLAHSMRQQTKCVLAITGVPVLTSPYSTIRVVRLTTTTDLLSLILLHLTERVRFGLMSTAPLYSMMHW